MNVAFKHMLPGQLHLLTSLIWSRLVFFWRWLLACATLPTVVSFTSASEVRPLSSAGVFRHRRYYEPVRDAMRPGLSLTGCWLVLLHHRWGFPCCGGAPCVCMPSPVPWRDRWMHALLSFFNEGGLRRSKDGSAPALAFSRPAQRSLRVTACILAGSPCYPLHRRLQRFRYLRPCSGCYRLLQHLSGGNLTD